MHIDVPVSREIQLARVVGASQLLCTSLDKEACLRITLTRFGVLVTNVGNQLVETECRIEELR